MNPIAIVDYGAGNLRSVQKAFQHLGHDARIVTDPNSLASSSAVVFPGQGAAPPAMAALKASGMDEAIRGSIADGTPFFGVCLGLQLLLDFSEEAETPCLGIIPGRARRFSPALKVPQIGWNSVSLKSSHPLFEGIGEDAYFYFVHSYYADPEDDSWVLGHTEYGTPFVSVAAKGNVVATQFHPEKSGPLGLRVYANFVRSFVEGA